MEKMKELYQKVAKDDVLLAKFSDILGDAEKSGAAETEKKLLDFAKEQGYDVSINEMKEFFQSMAEHSSEELSETELDMVAGGKSSKKWAPIIGGAIIAGSIVAGASGAGTAVSIGCVVGAGATEGAMS